MDDRDVYFLVILFYYLLLLTQTLIWFINDVEQLFQPVRVIHFYFYRSDEFIGSGIGAVRRLKTEKEQARVMEINFSIDMDALNAFSRSFSLEIMIWYEKWLISKLRHFIDFLELLDKIALFIYRYKLKIRIGISNSGQ